MSARTLIILGATGDLTQRLLLPGLDSVIAMAESGGRPLDIDLMGVGRMAESAPDWQAALERSIGSGPIRDRVRETARYASGDVTEPETLQRLFDEAPNAPVLYLALPPQVSESVVDALGSVRFPDDLRLAIEKPFGVDGRTAAALNARLARLIPESQVHRVDHFLGMSTVLNLLGLRFANRAIEAIWNADHVASIEIRFDESLALEGRAEYYDRVGALVDMIQSHLLLVHALVTMDAPPSLDPHHLHDSMMAALAATRLRGEPAEASRRARFTAGNVDGVNVPAYVDEDGVDAERNTETLVELELESIHNRFAGVPIVLRSGKALGEPVTEIRLVLRKSHNRPAGLRGDAPPTSIIVSLAPEKLAIELDINGAHDPFTLDRVTLSTDFAKGKLTAYGEVIAGILDGDDTLSVRGDIVEACWGLVDPVLATWRSGAVPLDSYAAGSGGPREWASH